MPEWLGLAPAENNQIEFWSHLAYPLMRQPFLNQNLNGDVFVTQLHRHLIKLLPGFLEELLLERCGIGWSDRRRVQVDVDDVEKRYRRPTLPGQNDGLIERVRGGRGEINWNKDIVDHPFP